MRTGKDWWRDRVRCCVGEIENVGADLLVAPGPVVGDFLLEADRRLEPGRSIARLVRVLRCATPPPACSDPAAYPGICAEDWFQVALEGAAGEGAASVVVPPLRYPDGDAGVAEGAMASVRRALSRHPSIQRLLIICADDETADRWRAALFASGRPHPCPAIAGELMRIAGADGILLPEECYRARAPGCLAVDGGIVYYQFDEDDGRPRLEVCELRGRGSPGQHLILEADGTSRVLPSVCGRRTAGMPGRHRIGRAGLRRRHDAGGRRETAAADTPGRVRTARTDGGTARSTSRDGRG